MHAGFAAALALRALAPAPDEQALSSDDPIVEIRWDAPTECGPSDALRERIETLLGRPLGHEGDPDLDVTARVETDASSLRLVLEFRQPVVRVRELRGQSCAELREAAAVVLAVTVDPLVPLAEDPPEQDQADSFEPAKPSVPSPDPTPEPAPGPAEQTDSPAVTQDPPATRARELEVLFRVAGGVGYGALASVAGAPSLAVALRWRALRAELVGAWWSSRPAMSPEVPELGATLSLGWAAPRVCGVPATERVSFPLCVGVELGGMRGRAFGLPGARTRTLAWVAAELGAALSVALPDPVGVWIGVDGVVPLVRPGFTIAGLGELHRAPAFAFQALLGLEIRFDASRSTDSRLAGQAGGA